MELKMVSENENPLFGRREVVYIAPSSPTPSREKVVQAIADKCKCAKECVVVDCIDQRFGKKSVEVRAKVYKSAEDAKRTERGYKFARLSKLQKKKEAPAKT